MCLFLCQYHTLLIMIALWYNFKSGSVIHLALFFFLKIVLAILGPLCLHTNFRIFFSSSVKKKCFGEVYIKSVDCFGLYGHFNNICSSNS